MKNALRKSRKSAKLKILSRRGETLTEVLVALLIACLSMSMLAGMIQASIKIINSADGKMEDYYEAGNRLASKELPDDDIGGTVSFSYEDASGSSIPIKLLPAENSIAVDYYTNSVLGETKKVVSYERKEP